MNRYARQQVLAQVGDAGQRRLREAHVLVVGAGALGCPALQYLVGAGIGCLTLVDPDVVERSNLHRQPLYGEASLGWHKTMAARDVLHDLNPEVDVRPLAATLDADNARSLVEPAAVVLDCADSFAASYLLSDTCRCLGTPLISASVLGLKGYAGGFCGTAPSLRAVFPELPAHLATCASAGVLGPVAGMLGCLQAQMALAVLLGLQPSPLGQMVVMELQPYRFRSFRFDSATEPAEPPFPFVARSQLRDDDLIVELRGTAEASEPVHPKAVRASVDNFRERAFQPAEGRRTVLCCRSGLRLAGAQRPACLLERPARPARRGRRQPPARAMTEAATTAAPAYAQPRAAVIAITFRGDEVLLVQRRNEPQKGGWGFPGGSIEPGESIREAALRELMEETGLQAEVLDLVDVIEVREFDPVGRHHHFILIAMLCRHLAGEPTPGDDALDCRWLRVPADLEHFGASLIEHVATVANKAYRQLMQRQAGNTP